MRRTIAEIHTELGCGVMRDVLTIDGYDPGTNTLTPPAELTDYIRFSGVRARQDRPHSRKRVDPIQIEVPTGGVSHRALGSPAAGMIPPPRVLTARSGERVHRVSVFVSGHHVKGYTTSIRLSFDGSVYEGPVIGPDGGVRLESYKRE